MSRRVKLNSYYVDFSGGHWEDEPLAGPIPERIPKIGACNLCNGTVE
jgi:hypothetical protein